MITGHHEDAWPGVIRIGVVGPLTGRSHHEGDAVEDVARFAVGQVNAGGGLAGKRVVIDTHDDAADPSRAVGVAHTLVRDRALCVVGHINSGCALAASEVYQNAGIPLITPGATHPSLTSRGFRTVFRTIGRDTAQSRVAATYITHHVRPKRVSVADDSTAYGQGLADEVARALDEKGLRVVGRHSTTDEAFDFRPMLEKIREEDADFVYYGGTCVTFGPLVKQARGLGLRARFMAGDAGTCYKTPELAQQATEGLLVTAPKPFPVTPTTESLDNALWNSSARGSSSKEPYVLPAYAAIQAAVEAMKRADSGDPAKITAVLHASRPFETAMGVVRFDSGGDLKEDFTFAVYEWRDGRRTEVTPQ